MTSLENFFNPRSIAVVGASHNKEKLGYRILKNIVEFNSALEVYPVNIKGGVILGRKAYKSLLEIPNRLDLAVVAIPAKFVPEVVKDAILKNVGALVVISAGFKESGEKGKRLEHGIKRMLEVARRSGVNVRILGVNCLGIVSYENKINASFLASVPRSGTLAFVSQSGAFGAALLDWAIYKKLGIRHFVSIGNKTDLTELDFFEYFLNDNGTRVIAAYLESIGHSTKEDGRRFVSLLRKITRKKPVVLVLPGESSYAKKAIGSHTGSLVDDAAVVKDTAIRNGAIVVQNLEEFFNVLLLLDSYPYSVLQKLNNLMVVTNAGGPGVLAADLISKNGFKLANLLGKTKNSLKKNLPVGVNVHGPVDVLGDADAEIYRFALETLLEGKESDGIVTILTPQGGTQVKETAKVIVELGQAIGKKYRLQQSATNYNKLQQSQRNGSNTLKKSEGNKFLSDRIPIFPVFIGGKNLEPAFKLFDQHKVPYFHFLSSLFTSIQRIVTPYREIKNLREGIKTGNVSRSSERMIEKEIKENIRKLLNLYLKYTPRETLFFKRFDPFLTETILKILKIPVPQAFYLSLTDNRFIKIVSDIFENVSYDFSNIYNFDSYNNQKDFIYKYVKKVSYTVRFPWVLKITGTNILHATDKGFIILNIKNKHQAAEKIHKFVNNRNVKSVLKSRKFKNIKYPYLYIQIQEQIPVDVEVFTGLKSSQIFDGILAFGWGGIYTEILKDVKQTSLPVTKDLISRFFKQTKVYSLIKGARGSKGFDFDKLIDVIYKISLLPQILPDFKEADFNPIIVNYRGVYVADYKILI